LDLGVGDLLLEPLSPGHQGQFQMTLSVLLQFFYKKTVHRLIFLILFGDDLKKLFRRWGLHQSLFEGRLLRR